MCKQCNNFRHITEGFGKTRKWETDGDGIIGTIQGIYGVQQYLSNKDKLKSQSRERAIEREEARRRLMAKQRKQLYE